MIQFFVFKSFIKIKRVFCFNLSKKKKVFCFKIITVPFLSTKKKKKKKSLQSLLQHIAICLNFYPSIMYHFHSDSRYLYKENLLIFMQIINTLPFWYIKPMISRTRNVMFVTFSY